MKKVVLISALLGAFAVNVFAANTPSNVNQTHTKAHHSKAIRILQNKLLIFIKFLTEKMKKSLF
ncbi:hypothetical protein F9I48_06395 [Campylobacter jejuni]|nr:hypothetical protein [Campylobacter jejuni]